MSENTEKRVLTDPAIAEAVSLRAAQDASIRREARICAEESALAFSEIVPELTRRERVALAVFGRHFDPGSWQSYDLKTIDRMVRSAFTIADAFLAESNRDTPPI